VLIQRLRDNGLLENPNVRDLAMKVLKVGENGPPHLLVGKEEEITYRIEFIFTDQLEKAEIWDPAENKRLETIEFNEHDHQISQIIDAITALKDEWTGNNLEDEGEDYEAVEVMPNKEEETELPGIEGNPEGDEPSA
jgi:hypothetical protein